MLIRNGNEVVLKRILFAICVISIITSVILVVSSKKNKIGGDEEIKEGIPTTTVTSGVLSNDGDYHELYMNCYKQTETVEVEDIVFSVLTGYELLELLNNMDKQYAYFITSNKMINYNDWKIVDTDKIYSVVETTDNNLMGRRIVDEDTGECVNVYFLNIGRTLIGSSSIEWDNVTQKYRINAKLRNLDEEKIIYNPENDGYYKDIQNFAFIYWDNRNAFEMTDEFYCRTMYSYEGDVLGYIFEPTDFKYN